MEVTPPFSTSKFPVGVDLYPNPTASIEYVPASGALKVNRPSSSVAARATMVPSVSRRATFPLTTGRPVSLSNRRPSTTPCPAEGRTEQSSARTMRGTIHALEADKADLPDFSC